MDVSIVDRKPSLVHSSYDSFVLKLLSAYEFRTNTNCSVKFTNKMFKKNFLNLCRFHKRKKYITVIRNSNNSGKWSKVIEQYYSTNTTNILRYIFLQLLFYDITRNEYLRWFSKLNKLGNLI